MLWNIFGPQDVRLLADNVVTILETVKSMTQPDMLSAMNNALTVFKSMDTTNIKEMSMWGAFKAMRSKEMKKSIGFMIAFLQKLSKTME
ncbi:MAG: DUF1641 domain-containing protein [Chloroflexia bacterium]|nr:DUF1641 domain-containing protein [Chloroflexia bacterium]